MNSLVKWTQWMGAGAIVLVAMTGCQDTNNNSQPDTISGPVAGKAVENTATAAGREVAEAGQAVENTAEAAGQAVENTAAAAGQAVAGATNKAIKGAKNLDDAATITPAVKTALGANAALAGSNINVDTTDQNVTLSGTVKNAAQKKLAVNIAQKNAAGYKIVDKLTMAGGASPMMKKKP